MIIVPQAPPVDTIGSGPENTEEKIATVPIGRNGVSDAEGNSSIFAATMLRMVPEIGTVPLDTERDSIMQAPEQPGYPSPQGFPPQQGYPPPKTGMGCGAKLLIFFGGLFLLFVLLCCGGFFGFGYWIKSSVTTEPDAVRAVTQEITAIEVPAGMEPTSAMNLHVPFSGRMLAVFAAYADKDQKNFLMVGAMGDFLDVQMQAQFREGFEQSLRQQGVKQGGHEQLQDRQASQEKRTIRGQPAVFNIATGKSPGSGRPRIEVQGTFQGNTGAAMLLLEADSDQISKEQVLEMIDSIK
jgi:hypothetical protein